MKFKTWLDLQGTEWKRSFQELNTPAKCLRSKSENLLTIQKYELQNCAGSKGLSYCCHSVV